MPDENDKGLTAHSPAVSAALRAQVIEECAKVADAEADKVDGSNADRYWQSRRIATAIRSLSSVPAIAPSAISEAPTSADAVKTSPEVGEMVERLTTLLDWYGKHYFNTIPEARTLTYDRCMALSHMCTQAASLLIALDAERGRLREALKAIYDTPDQLPASVNKIIRSALPASDEGTTNE